VGDEVEPVVAATPAASPAAGDVSPLEQVRTAAAALLREADERGPARPALRELQRQGDAVAVVDAAAESRDDAAGPERLLRDRPEGRRDVEAAGSRSSSGQALCQPGQRRPADARALKDVSALERAGMSRRRKRRGDRYRSPSARPAPRLAPLYGRFRWLQPASARTHRSVRGRARQPRDTLRRDRRRGAGGADPEAPPQGARGLSRLRHTVLERLCPVPLPPERAGRGNGCSRSGSPGGPLSPGTAPCSAPSPGSSKRRCGASTRTAHGRKATAAPGQAPWPPCSAPAPTCASTLTSTPSSFDGAWHERGGLPFTAVRVGIQSALRGRAWPMGEGGAREG
jgi:hypothetical protein